MEPFLAPILSEKLKRALVFPRCVTPDKARELRLKEMETLFQKHDRFIGKDSTRASRLMAHLWLVRELELRHFFGDGNGRSTNMLLVSFISKEPDLPMLMIENPNILDANGPEKLAYRTLQAMDNFKRNGKAKVFERKRGETLKLADLKVSQDLEELRKELQKFTKGLEWKQVHEQMDLAH